MTLILQELGTGGGGGGSTPPAVNVHGTQTVVPANTVTLCSHSAIAWGFRGFIATSDGDALFWVEVDGTEIPGMAGRISRVNKDVKIVLPNPETLVGSVVSLRVANETGTSVTCEGTLLGQ